MILFEFESTSNIMPELIFGFKCIHGQYLLEIYQRFQVFNDSDLVVIKLHFPKSREGAQVLQFFDKVPTKGQRLNLVESLKVFNLVEAVMIQVHVKSIGIKNSWLLATLIRYSLRPFIRFNRLDRFCV